MRSLIFCFYAIAVMVAIYIFVSLVIKLATDLPINHKTVVITSLILSGLITAGFVIFGLNSLYG